MKKLSCFLLFYTAVLFASAQIDVTNNGIFYISGSADTVTVAGNFTNASSASLTNNGRFYAKQNYTNNQASTPVGTGELTLNGTAAQSISTTSTSPFYKLTVNKATESATLSSAVEPSARRPLQSSSDRSGSRPDRWAANTGPVRRARRCR